MKKITVYADFDFLSAAQEIGTLGYEHVRGKDHFVFEYSRDWLKQYGGILLSGDLMNVPSLQHPRGNDNVFGFVNSISWHASHKARRLSMGGTRYFALALIKSALSSSL